MADAGAFEATGERLRELDRLVAAMAPNLAVWFVYDRPSRVLDRPGLAAAYFAERCVSDRQLQQMIDALREVGGYAELLGGDVPFVEALVSGRMVDVGRRWNVVYNGLESGIAPGGFRPGRRALVPSLADAYGLLCANSNGYGCVLARHKVHYFAILDQLGFRVPLTWGWSTERGWMAGRAPEPGTTVIVKSTYESWSIGVTEESVFELDGPEDERVRAISEQIGQPVTVQQFIPGTEACVPVLVERDGARALPPVLTVLTKSPGDPMAIMTIGDNLVHEAVAYEAIEDGTLVSELATVAAEVCLALELEGLARIDLRVDRLGTPFITDVGAAPGMGAAGSTATSAGLVGVGHSALIRSAIGARLAAEGSTH